MSPIDYDGSVDDRFEQYFAEKLWAWIPEVYRQFDGPPPQVGALRSLVELLATQSSLARRSIDRLWEDLFIESSDEWAVPYLGELVGARMLSELNRRGRRADVANTIYYRRRKGTPLVLEQLVRDITGWEAVLVEGFRTLARTRHGLDAAMTGEVGTATGGTCSIRDLSTAASVEPFALSAHTPDVRALRGQLGRYNITKLNFHLFRQGAMALRSVTPMAHGDGRFSFDPSGRDVPLFLRSSRELAELEWRAPTPWELPRPMPCALLGSYRLALSLPVLGALRESGADDAAVDSLLPFVGRTFRSLTRLDQLLARVEGAAPLRDSMATFIAFAQSEDSPHERVVHPDASLWMRLLGDDVPPTAADVARRSASISAANLSGWDQGPLFAGQIVAVDPARGRFIVADGEQLEEVSLHHIGAFGEVGAGPYERREALHTDASDIGTSSSLTLPSAGVHEIRDSRSYELEATVVNVEKLTVQASNYQRPYLFRAGSPTAEWGFRGTTDDSVLTLDGLWLGAQLDGAAPDEPAVLVLDGKFDLVTLRHCTVDPGGASDTATAPSTASVNAITPIVIDIRGTVRELRIEQCVTGAIRESGDGAVETIVVRDSIVQQLADVDAPAIETSAGELQVERSTLIGDVRVSRLYASELVAAGVVDVTDNQHGCFRFSATGLEGDLPKQFESHRLPGGIQPHFFVSQRFGDPGYAQLSRSAPSVIATGAETRSEMGVFSQLLSPIKLADLRAKVREYMPFGLVPQFVFER